ncbi:sce7726 family protein [Glutamicibacter sp. Je.9.36]|uniref:sce7726 family protein n=1 Tax=Glutamicibacter sp. Je.9.36 TaxID=3142837 RepID=UPI003DA846A3
MAPSPSSTLADAYDSAFKYLFLNRRNEYVFKNQIVSKIVFGRHSPRTASALLELHMGKSIADVVVINGTTTAYEIKTDLDDFSRLSSQLVDYTRHTEHAFVVVSDKRAHLAEQQIPDSVGLYSLRPNGALSLLRPSASHLDRFSTDNLFKLLRTSEAADLLHRVNGYEPDVPSGHLWLRMRELFKRLSIETVHKEVLVQLKKRNSNATKLVSPLEFPRSLRALAYSTELSRVGVERVHERLSTRASELLVS